MSLGPRPVLLVHRPGRLVDQQPDAFQVGVAIGQGELDAFESGQGAAKSAALLDVFHAHLQDRLGGPHTGRADEHPRRRKALHGVVKAPVHLADHVTVRQAHVFQGKAAGRDAHAPHVLEKGGGDARRIFERQGEKGKGFVPGLGIGVGAGQQQVDAAHLQRFAHAADEHLFPVQHPVCAVAHPFGAAGPQDVGAAPRLGGGDAQESLARRHAGQDLGPQFRRAVAVKDEPPGRFHQIEDRHGQADVGPAQLFGSDGGQRPIHACAADLLGADGRQQSQLGHARDDLAGDALLGIDLAHPRGDLALGKIAHRLPPQSLLFVPTKIHLFPPVRVGSSAKQLVQPLHRFGGCPKLLA